MIIEVEKDDRDDRFPTSVAIESKSVEHMLHSVSELSWCFLNHGGEKRLQSHGYNRRKKGNGPEVPCLFVCIGSPRMATKLLSLR